MDDATLLIVFTVVEAVLLVGVLLGSFVLVARRLRAIRDAMAEATVTVDALERELAELRPGGQDLVDALGDLAAMLSSVNQKAERLAVRERG